MNAKEVFEKEWAMYGERGSGRDGIWSRKGKSVKDADSFDGDVKPGEIRIFADMERPFIALVGRIVWRWYGGWSIAAMLLVCLGATWLVLNNEQKSYKGLNVFYTSAEPMACRNIKNPADAQMNAKIKKSARRVHNHWPVGAAAPVCGAAQTAECYAPAVEAYGRERYAQFNRNEFLEVVHDPLSTFGLDVDTASYTTLNDEWQKNR